MPSDLKRTMSWEQPAPSEYASLRQFLGKKVSKFALLALIVLFFVYELALSSGPLAHRSYHAPSLSQSERAAEGADVAAAGVQPLVGKVHAVFGDLNPTYEKALVLHENHAVSHGHPMFVLRERLLSGLWSKPAYILSIILQELTLPEDLRLKWLLWNDADIVIMNNRISLDIFIPPETEFDYVNMLVTNDRHGLNNGVFLIRVNDWSVKLLSAVIAFHTFKPDVVLKYSEQSALEEMIEDAYWRKAVVHVPQYWFNAYPTSTEKETFKNHEFRAGGLQIHFAGNKDGKRPERMEKWMDISQQLLPEWDVPIEETFYAQDLHAFWSDLSEKRAAKGIPGGGAYKAEFGGAASNRGSFNEEGVDNTPAESSEAVEVIQNDTQVAVEKVRQN